MHTDTEHVIGDLVTTGADDHLFDSFPAVILSLFPSITDHSHTQPHVGDQCLPQSSEDRTFP